MLAEPFEFPRLLQAGAGDAMVELSTLSWLQMPFFDTVASGSVDLSCHDSESTCRF